MLPFDLFVTRAGTGTGGLLRPKGTVFLDVPSYFLKHSHHRSDGTVFRGDFNDAAEHGILKALKIGRARYRGGMGIPFYRLKKEVPIFAQELALITPYEAVPYRNSHEANESKHFAAFLIPPMTNFARYGYVFPGLVETTGLVLSLEGKKQSLVEILRTTDSRFKGIPVSKLSPEELVELDRLLDQGLA